MKPILEILNISKKYKIYKKQEPYRSLREDLISWYRRNKEKKEDFYALQGITFQVMPGESIGIIGKNGAGKSTLLKIISRITPPTSGKIIVRGRIASLLEVGTGFHPELTGRENIFFNGSILGMKRDEIKRKFDEIVDFSGIERFIDTPLKHYSSGMQLRLAFAVAAFLEAEILVVDEVLAVGDAEFQKKCIGKMEDVTKNEGRTVLFVSHNMGSIKQICQQTILLEKGRLILKGPCEEVIAKYLHNEKRSASTQIFRNEKNHFLTLHSLKLLNAKNDTFSICFDEPIQLQIKFSPVSILHNVSVAVGVTTIDNIPLFTTRSEILFKSLSPSASPVSCNVSIKHNLRAGLYRLIIGIANGNFSYYYLPDAAILEILNYGRKPYNEMDTGIIHCDSEWMIA